MTLASYGLARKMATSSQLSHKTKHVLVVEDEDLIRETVADALRQENYKVSTAANGKEAVEFLEELAQQDYATLPLNLLILDLMLPHVSGLEICRFLRSRGSDIPILILSAKGSETDRVVGLEVGADDYLPKPFGIRELLARCSALLRRCQTIQATETILKVKDIVMYLDSHRVMVRGKEVTLSPKEFNLLELFMRHPRRIWSREQIIARVWGEDYRGETKTIDVHIRWLREKLEVDPGEPEYILTERGFGYRLWAGQ